MTRWPLPFLTLLALTTACGSPTPPDGYRHSFTGILTTTLIYGDPALSVPPAEATYNVTLVETEEEGVYTTEIGVCPLTLEIAGIPPSGVVQLSPRTLPASCAYRTETGSTFDIEWTSADIDWSPDQLSIDLRGPFVHSVAGQPDQGGEYRVFGTLY